MWWLTLYASRPRGFKKAIARKVFNQHIAAMSTQWALDRAMCLSRPVENSLIRCVHGEFVEVGCQWEVQFLREELLCGYRRCSAGRPTRVKGGMSAKKVGRGLWMFWEGFTLRSRT